jgi:hypothetical protein
MNVCIYVFVCARVNIYMYIYVYVYIYTYVVYACISRHAAFNSKDDTCSAFYIDVLSMYVCMYVCMYVWTLPGKVSKYYAMKSKPQVLTLHALCTFIFISIYTAKCLE